MKNLDDLIHIPDLKCVPNKNKLWFEGIIKLKALFVNFNSKDLFEL